MPDDAPATGTTDDAPAEGGQDKDWQAEAEKWKTLARKHEQSAKANAGAADRLKEIEDQGKTEMEKATSSAAEATSRADTAEAALHRLRFGLSKGLPAELAERLQGSTEEELAADAERLLKLVGPGPDHKKPPPSFDGGSRPAGSSQTDMNQLIRGGN